MSRLLLIDHDERQFLVDRIDRTFELGISSLKNDGPWDELYLDYDLGDINPKHTGEGIMKFLEEFPEYKPGKIIFTTSNAVELKIMEFIRKKIYNE